MGRADKSARITAAVAAIQSGEVTDYCAAAKIFQVDRISINKRVRGLTHSRKDANAFWKQALSNAQEKVLIDRINTLTDRGIPPTSSIVRSLAEEIRGAPVGKNWTSQFVHRHNTKLKSAYLRNIDNLRFSAEHIPMFILFFQLVIRCLFHIIIFHKAFS